MRSVQYRPRVDNQAKFKATKEAEDVSVPQRDQAPPGPDIKKTKNKKKKDKDDLEAKKARKEAKKAKKEAKKTKKEAKSSVPSLSTFMDSQPKQKGYLGSGIRSVQYQPRVDSQAKFKATKEAEDVSRRGNRTAPVVDVGAYTIGNYAGLTEPPKKRKDCV
jgi:hypothetical protein